MSNKDVETREYSLLFGDCLERMKEIPDGSVDLVLVDLPYGTTQNKWDSVIPFEPMWGQLYRVLKRDGACVMFSSQPFTTLLIGSNLKGFRYNLIWEKQKGSDPLNAKRKPLKSHEDINLFYRKQPTYNPQFELGEAYVRKGDCSVKSSNFNKAKETETVINDGKRYPKSVLRFTSEGMNSGSLHPTQKPVALLEYLIKTYTNENEVVLDFTAGSFSTGVACINTNRKFLGIEMNEGYFNIGVKRMQESTMKGEIK